MLTRKQSEILEYISDFMKNRGVSPSFEEMKHALNLKSKSGIHRLISGLEERGFIRRLPNRARALEIIKLPENEKSSNSSQLHDDSISIPFVGKIAAGLPIEAINNPNETLNIPKSIVNQNYKHFALRVEGDSMIDLGILDNDIAIIQSSNTAIDGSIVVALIDEEETTLKKLRIKGSSIALEPANKNYETKIFGPDRVKIQGILAAMYRLYN